MKLYKIGALVLLIIILVAGYLMPYVAPRRGYMVPCAYDKTRRCQLGCDNREVGGCEPRRGGIP
ncbi:hypothetical protein LguiA_030068 [Lonicera macranthoides]